MMRQEAEKRRRAEKRELFEKLHPTRKYDFEAYHDLRISDHHGLSRAIATRPTGSVDDSAVPRDSMTAQDAEEVQNEFGWRFQRVGGV